MSTPITPKQAEDKKTIPDFVIDAFNDMIVKNLRGNRSYFKQDDVVEEIISYAPDGTTEEHVYDKGWLDVEDIYRKAGWLVNYDKPGYNESYDATFTFDKKRK